MSGTVKGLVLLLGFTMLSGCALPRYETSWESYKKTNYSANVQSRICQSDASIASAEMSAKLAAHYNQELENCKNRAASAPSSQTVNVYGSANGGLYGSGNSGVQQSLGRIAASRDKQYALQACQTTRTLANVNLGNMANSHGQRAFEKCMVGAGFLSKRVCVANCQK